MQKVIVLVAMILLVSGLLFLASCTGNENQADEGTGTETKMEVTELTMETTQETTVKPVTEQTEKKVAEKEETEMKETEKKETQITTQPDFSKMSALKKYRWDREQIKNDPDRVFLYDNDGNDIVYYTNEVTVESALRTRFYPLKDSAVDAVFYTPWSSGFHMYTHDTKVGQIFDTTESDFKNNKARAFIDQGIDYFAPMVEYCHDNNMEMFFGMRMNDTHDNQGGWYGELMFQVNQFKVDHPELLVGETGKNPVYGTWTSVDFTHQIIRNMVYDIFEEACQNYNIDGIHLDFFRHPCFFKDAANGNPLKQETLDLMTDMMRQIREMTEREGMKRKRPILVSVRVPDSVEFCRAIGLDLEQWLREDLLDLLCTSGYTQLNDWEYSVALGHKYGVRVYPSLDETRVRDDNANKSRMALESYYARLSNVFDAGADGFLLFNFYNYSSPIFKTGKDPQRFLMLNKHYFVSYRGVGYFSRTWPHRDFMNIPTVNPYDKLELKKGQLEEVVFRIGEDLEKAKEKGRTPSIYLRISLEQAKQKDKIIVEFNGKILDRPLTIPSILSYKLEPSDIRKGLNTLKLMIRPQGDDWVYITDIVVDFYYN